MNWNSHPTGASHELRDDGVITLCDRRITATPHGRYLLRNIAMCFARYIARPHAADDYTPRFSNAV